MLSFGGKSLISILKKKIVSIVRYYFPAASSLLWVYKIKTVTFTFNLFQIAKVSFWILGKIMFSAFLSVFRYRINSLFLAIKVISKFA